MFLHLLSSSSYSNQEVGGINLEPGDLIFSRAIMAKKSLMSIKDVDVAFRSLLRAGWIKRKNHFKTGRGGDRRSTVSVISIVDWSDYNGYEKIASQQLPIIINSNTPVSPVENFEPSADPLVVENPKKGKKEKKSKVPFQEWQVHIEFIVDELNKAAKSNRGYDTLKTRELIARWLKAGYFLYDFGVMITYKAKEWMGTQFEDYLRPQTLFSAEHFQAYVEDSISSKSKGFIEKSKEYKSWWDKGTLLEQQEKWLKKVESEKPENIDQVRFEQAKKAVEELKNYPMDFEEEES